LKTNFKFLSRSEKIDISSAIITISFALIILFYYINGFIYGYTYPRNSFLTPPIPFGDFLAAYSQWRDYQFLGVGFGLSYFPASYIFINFFSYFNDVYIALILFNLIFYIPLIIYIYLTTNSINNYLLSLKNIIVYTLFCYPVLLAFQTGNIEIIVLFFIILFIYLYKSNNYVLSSASLAMAISIKLIPIVFLLIIFSDRRYKLIFSTFIFIILFSVLPLIFFKGGFDSGIFAYFGRLAASQKLYFDLMVLSQAGIHFGHSIYNSLCILLPSIVGNRLGLNIYLTLTLIFFVLVLFYVYRTPMEFWQKVCLSSALACLLPYTSTDYKLILFLPALFLFFNSINKSKYNYLYNLLITLLLVPKNYLYFNNNPLHSLNSIMNTSILIFLVIILFLDTKNNNLNK